MLEALAKPEEGVGEAAGVGLWGELRLEVDGGSCLPR